MSSGAGFLIFLSVVYAIDGYMYVNGASNCIFFKDKTHAELIMRTRKQFGDDGSWWPEYRKEELRRLLEKETQAKRIIK